MQLHRVLYLIKFLRAIVLHLLLALVAALLFFLVGIDGVYPIANDMIHALRAQSIQNQLQGGPIGSLGYVIVVAVLSEWQKYVADKIRSADRICNVDEGHRWSALGICAGHR